MGTFLRLVIVLLGVWLVLRLVKRALLKDDHPSSPSSSPAAIPPADMLRCDYCGMFVPRNEATMVRGKPYCGGDHADAAGKKT
jgi:uncharacterized protein